MVGYIVRNVNAGRTKIKRETVIKFFPIFCPKCKYECLIDVENMNIKLSVEPDIMS